MMIHAPKRGSSVFHRSWLSHYTTVFCLMSFIMGGLLTGCASTRSVTQTVPLPQEQITAQEAVDISLAIRTPASAPPKAPSDWPPFTMEYREEGNVHVIAQAEPGFQRYRFIFNTPKDWTHIITDSTQKEFIGSYKQYTGASLIDFDASSNDTTTKDTAKDAPYIPDQWLSIGYIKGLQQMPNVTKEETGDPALGKLIETSESPCDEADPSLTNCKPGQKMRIGSREITYHLNTLIPVLVVDKVDGEAVYTATVEKLELR